MERRLLLARLRPYRFEIKYGLLTLLSIGGLVALAGTDALQAIEDEINWFMDEMTGLGLFGVFLVALVANASLMIQIPYTLPMLSVALYSDSLADLVALGVATGVGAGLGEIVSYAIAYNIAAQIKALSRSALFRWIRDAIDRHPRLIPLFVFIGAALPIPDDLIIMPLAMVNYPIRRLLVPMFTGKVLHNFTVSFVFHYATRQSQDYVGSDVNVDLSLAILIGFILIVAYQVEKTRARPRDASEHDASDTGQVVAAPASQPDEMEDAPLSAQET